MPWRKPPPPTSSPSDTPLPRRLHIGSGAHCLKGWINLDIREFPGVDVIADVRDGLDFEDLEAVYSEHFLEHLAVDDAVRLLMEIHRVLRPGGWMRISTPNLDWVWKTHYLLETDAANKRQLAVVLNRAFYGWEHKFLWNREMLEEVLGAVGFEELRWCRYGESEQETFRGLEGHEPYQDYGPLVHILIVEARKGKRRARDLERLRSWLKTDFLDHVAAY